MRKLIVPLLVCLLAGCAVDGDLTFHPQAPTPVFGKWKLMSFADNVKIPYGVIIELDGEVTENGKYTIKGKSPVNFYYATFAVDFKSKKLQLFGVGSTKIPGDEQAIDFEKKYYDLLAKVVTYEVSADGNSLIMSLKPEENQHIKFIRQP